MNALDNPIHSALTTDHAAFALVHGDARRYPAEEVGRGSATIAPDVTLTLGEVRGRIVPA